MFSDASGIDFRAMLKKKQHAKQNEEPEPDSAELKPIEEPVVELKKAEKVGAGVEDRLFPHLYRNQSPFQEITSL